MNRCKGKETGCMDIPPYVCRKMVHGMICWMELFIKPKVRFCCHGLIFSVVLTAVFVSEPDPVFASGTCAAKVSLLKNREYADALLKGIRNSRKSIILSCYLFKINPSKSSMPGRVAEELIKAGNHGVEVTVVFEISNDTADPLNAENRETASFLSRNGIRVFFDSPRTKSHLKAALIDDRYVFVGSHNLTQSALKYNNEVSVLVESPEIASEMRSYLKHLMMQQWRRLP